MNFGPHKTLRHVTTFIFAIALIMPFCNGLAIGQGNGKELADQYQSDFGVNHDDWEFIDDSWKFSKLAGDTVLSLHQKKSNYAPRHRSPGHLALLKGHSVADFELTVRALSTHEPYDHQDVCLFFGYQSPTEFYYVHLGKKTDDHANQIFIVNNAARTKISLKTTQGTAWDKKWHRLRVARDTESGRIDVFFDDMKTPAMSAVDKTFRWGRVGLGSFDDTADFDDFILKGTAASGQ